MKLRIDGSHRIAVIYKNKLFYRKTVCKTIKMKDMIFEIAFEMVMCKLHWTQLMELMLRFD